MRLDLVVDLLDDGGGAVGAHLGEAAQVAGVEAQGDDGVAAAGLGLGDDARDGVVAGVVELLGCQFWWF